MIGLADPDPPPLPGNRWQVQLLGGLQLRCGDIRILRFPDRPTRLLFARLALQPQVLHGRDSLAQALWPEVLEADGRHERSDAAEVRRERLRKTLSKLIGLFRTGGTQHLEPIHAERETLRLNAAAFDIDVHRFDRHCARRQHEAARACYGGELLPGLADDWIEGERTRLAAARARLDDANPAKAAAEADDDLDLDADGAADDLARTAPASPAPMTLPPPRQHFFGRDAELDGVRRALQAHRLVTLVGPGGCGKTALAAQIAEGGQGFAVVAMVWLEDCMAPAGIVDRVRVALDLQRDGGDPLAQIAAHLDTARTLLVLDNFEQLVNPAGVAELDRLLRALPTARLLVTTRRGFDLDAASPPSDELAACRIDLRTLPVPAPGDELGAAARNPGVALFVAAAQAARADFSLNRRNLAGVIAVCRQLEGLPLSIELAAAKIRDFAPRDMAIALAQSAKLLARTQTRPGQGTRHASLAMALAWSWRLLAEPARDALRRLAMCRGGWTSAQARALIGGPDEHDTRHADALLAGLARDSLLQAVDADGGPARQGLLVVLREFVVEQCSPAQALDLRRQHRALFLAEAQRLAATGDWPAEADDPNCVEALETACTDGDDATALGLAAALAEPWGARGTSAQAIDALRVLTRRAPLPAAARVDLLVLLATLLINAGLGRQAHAEVALALQLAGEDSALRTRALLAQCQLLWRADRSAAGMAQALAVLLQAEALLTALRREPAAAANPAWTRLHGRLLLAKGALTLMHLRQVDDAAALFEQAERLFSVLGDRRSAVLALPGRVACLLKQAHYRQVITVATKGEHEAAALGDAATRLQLLDRLSNAHEASGQFQQAVQASQRQTRLSRRHGLHHYASYGVWNQCLPLAQLGEHDLAARLLAFACKHWIGDNGELDPDDKAYVAEVRQLVSAHLGAARLRAAWARGQAMSLHEALELASGRPAPQRDRTP